MKLKRFVPALLTLLALLLPLAAHAQTQQPVWKTKEVFWRVTRFLNGSSTNAVITDTMFTHLGGTNANLVPDTTAWFTLENLALPPSFTPQASPGSPAQDSVLVAIVTVVQDSTADATPAISEFPYLAQMGYDKPLSGSGYIANTGSGRGGILLQNAGVQVATPIVSASMIAATTGPATSGDRMIQIPLYLVPAFNLDETAVSGARRWGPLLNAAGAGVGSGGMRVIFPQTTFVGAAGLCSARVYVTWPTYTP